MPKLGTAHRWTIKDKKHATLQDVPPSLFVQVSEMRNALLSKDVGRIALLSPAEKFDFIQSGGLIPDDGLLESLRDQDNFLNQEPMGSYLEAGAPKGRAAFNLLSDIRLAEAEGSDLKTINQKSEQLKDLAQELEALLTPQVQNARWDYSRIVTADARRLASSYPLTADAWNSFALFYPQFSSPHQWRWMGICHGWSLAALGTTAPTHAVKVTVNETDVILSEGDIRGLLTKAWADQSPQTMLVGTRCDTTVSELESLQVDSLGRIIDGRICDGRNQNYTCQDGQTIEFVDKDFIDGMFTFKRPGDKDSLRLGVIVGQGPADSGFHILEFDSIQDYQLVSKDGLPRATDHTERLRTVQNFSVCRDTNPMTFHIAAMELLGKDGPGFVMDIARGSEVWNQPVFSYESKIIPVIRRDGTLSGTEPVSTSEIDDLLARFRAKGKDYTTKHLLQMETKVQFTQDSGPLLAYKTEDVAPMVVQYTLEFDENMILRGGEWGPIPTTQNIADTELARWRNSSSAPDFVWMAEPGAEPTPGRINYGLLKEILKCSQQSSSERKKFTWPVLNEEVFYVDCTLPGKL
jgi:hypothetical protein